MCFFSLFSSAYAKESIVLLRVEIIIMYSTGKKKKKGREKGKTQIRGTSQRLAPQALAIGQWCLCE